MAEGGRAPFMRTMLLLALAVVPLSLAGCSKDDGGHAHSEVTIENNLFTPASITIAAGEGVIWINHDTTSHSETSDDGDWDSGVLTAHEEGDVLFETPGTFAYHCRFHGSMEGIVIVE